jgi:heavy metal-(Cd/Co/Hg/Pb/Zn)-translocating P-type ATPase
MEDRDHHSAHQHNVARIAAGSHGPGAAKENMLWVNREWILAGVSLVLLLAGLLMDHVLRPDWLEPPVRLIWYLVAYLPVGTPVVAKGVRLAFRGEIFTEFLLMGIATLGAFYIGEYPEGVAVMVFYAIGELFQGAAVTRAKRNIKSLLDVRPERARVFREGSFTSVDPAIVDVGEVIQVMAGERVPLDGTMISEGSSFNTSALTGESRPASINKGERVLAGMINEDRVAELQVEKKYNESSLARILTLVERAQGRKAKTELFIRRFARAYTPIVVFLAIGLTFIPYFFVENYEFEEWLYRALIFLVISCPCALVIAIPLGYFGGIGAGSRNGILFKGSSYLDRMTRIGTVVMDKTGTLTKGTFVVQKVISQTPINDWLPLVSALEAHSSHPTAKAIVQHAGNRAHALPVRDVEETRGAGIRGTVDGKNVIAGNLRMMERHNIRIDSEFSAEAGTIVYVAIDNLFAGALVIGDEIKPDAKEAVDKLRRQNIRMIMLSGDRQDVVSSVASALDIEEAYGDLLPEDKVAKFEAIKKNKKEAVAFVGDGINDAPVLTLSDVGIAMGGLGSDAAIETADVVIQTDQPSKIVTAIQIGKATNAIVWQNITFAFGVKLIVMIAGAWGVASMWEAVFADVGVALLAILNAIRIQRKKF